MPTFAQTELQAAAKTGHAVSENHEEKRIFQKMIDRCPLLAIDCDLVIEGEHNAS